MRKVIVVIAKNTSIGEFLRILDRLNLLSFSRGGPRILIKPNVNTDDPYPGTSNPDLVREIIRKLYDKGASEIVVGDSSSIVSMNTRLNMKKIGIEKAALDAGGRVVAFEEGRWIKIKPDRSKHWRIGFHIPRIVQEFDYLVNLTVIKTHFLATYTGALKNMVGCIKRLDRIWLHLGNISAKIAEINLAISPVINILDARKVFIKGGPRRGELRDANILIASKDRVASDAVGLAVLKLMGARGDIQKLGVWGQGQIKSAISLNLGIKSPNEIEIRAF
ncbi:hypothetical protein DRN86_04560, partial [Candidatus Geothermarchaeota archaeon]